MSEHHALGYPRGSGGVNDAGHIIGLHILAHCHESGPILLQRTAADFHQCLKRHYLRWGAIHRVHDNNLPKAGNPCCDAQYLFQLKLCGNNNRAGFRIEEEIGNLHSGEGDVERHVDRTDG